jgi:DNA polymerase-3 subunit delta
VPVLAPPSLSRHLRRGEVAPLYLIVGEDEAGKADLVNQFVEAIDADLRPFNVDRFQGGEASVAQILDAARTLPLEVPRRLVLVLRAERLLVPRRDTDQTSRDLEALDRYLDDPAPHTMLVFEAAPLDERRRIVKRLVQRAVVVRCDGVIGPADGPRWIRARVVEAGRRIDPAALGLLAERAGTDLARLRAACDRLLLYVGDRETITVEDVLEVTGQPGVGDDWAVARAIERGDAATALRELARALEAGAAPVLVLGQLAWVVRTRLAPARVPDAVDALYRTDLDLKSSAGDPRVLLERLVVELCCPAGR